jgi:hypothetical protein
MRRDGSTYTIENEAALSKYRSDTHYKVCNEEQRDETRKQSGMLVYMVIEWDASMQMWQVTTVVIQVGGEFE